MPPTVTAAQARRHVPRQGRRRRQGRASRSSSSTRTASRGWPGRPWSPATRRGPPDQADGLDRRPHRQGHRQPGTRSSTAPATATTTARRHHRHLRQRLVVLDDRHRPAPASPCGGQDGTVYTGTDDVWGNGSGTNLETACVDVHVRDRQGVGHARVLARPQRHQGQRHGYPARVGLNDVNAYWDGVDDQLRPQLGQRPPAHRDRHRRPRERPRHLPDHARVARPATTRPAA